MNTLSSWLSKRRILSPRKTAIICDGQDIDYATFADLSARLASGLTEKLKVKRGDRVAFLGENCPEMLLLLFACARLGAIFLPINWRLASPEIIYILRNSGANHLVHDSKRDNAALSACSSISGLCRVSLDGIENAFPSFNDIINQEPWPENPNIVAEDPVLLIYTSGTTGKPKGALLTQSALSWNAINSSDMHNLSQNDLVLTTIPMFHVGGLNIQTLPALRVGATVILHRGFDPASVLRTIKRKKVTLTVLVPSQMQSLVTHESWPESDLKSLRMITTGSTIVAIPLIEIWHGREVPVVQVYGTTETAPIAAYLRARQALEHAGSVGMTARHCELRIVGANGHPVPKNTPGEIQIRGPNVMREYWNDPTETDKAFVGKWFRTGDIGKSDASGFLTIIDRQKDLIISGGENIYPAELEQILESHPGVSEAAVIEQEDVFWGAVPVAFVVRKDPNLTPSQILKIFEGQIARFKRPKAIFFLDSLPRNTMGKVNKSTLKDLTPHD